METMNKKCVVFRITLTVFLFMFLFSTFFQATNVPTMSDLAFAIFSPFEHVGSPINDWLAGLEALRAFAFEGSLPTLENLLDLFLMPFKVLVNVVVAIIDILGNLVDLFS